VTPAARVYWDAFLALLPPDHPARAARVVAEQFGDTQALADELGALIVRGAKKATCSALWEWEAEGQPIPAPGMYQVVLDGGSRPLCIIEVTEVDVRPFRAVDEVFAAAEGEGDRSHAYWRDGHWRYFSRVLPLIGRTPSEDMPLVCERFRVVFSEAPPEQEGT
jgi:uncharacterized protein YhfF